MTATPVSTPAPPADAAVLLVLLPPVASGGAGPDRAVLHTALRTLQQQLGPTIRVLKVDEARHPIVVRSFHINELPAFVLVHKGIELWREQGLPEGEGIVPLLLSKVGPPVPGSTVA